MRLTAQNIHFSYNIVFQYYSIWCFKTLYSPQELHIIAIERSGVHFCLLLHTGACIFISSQKHKVVGRKKMKSILEGSRNTGALQGIKNSPG